MSASRVAASNGHEPFFKVRRVKGIDRKLGLKESYRQKLLRMPRGRRYKAIERALKKSPLKRESKSHRAAMAKYRKLEAEFLSRPENKWCESCTRRRESGENILRNQSTEVHHFAGRIGRLLCYLPYFIASCFECREWPHKNTRKARAMRLLAQAKDWNVFPAAGKSA